MIVITTVYIMVKNTLKSDIFCCHAGSCSYFTEVPMMKKRTIAAALSLLLCCFGANALAKTETNGGLTIESENGDWTFDANGRLTITKAGSYTLSGSGESVTIDDVNSPVTLTLDGVTLSYNSGAALKTNNSAKTTIVLKGKNNLTSSSSSYAALDNGTNPLEITCIGCDTAGHTCGELMATSNSSGAAAIGSGNNNPCSNLTISGGKISADGGYFAASIGSGWSGKCSNLTISDGTVIATNSSTAIGAGQKGTVDGINISGGTIVATTTGSYAAGIGSGGTDIYGDGLDYGTVSNINISGGNITAIGGGNGAGIGAGGYSSASNITISGGDINIQANSGAGIGCGGNISIEFLTTASNINITGGKINIKINHGAGVGSGHLSYARDINISGGEITVTPSAGGAGAGIGSGWNGNVDGITITGGNFNLLTAYGAGIGGGSGGDTNNITISGGNIHAESRYGVGIGGGGSYSTIVKNITISDGSITAIGGERSPGIGCGMSGYVNNIIITGGSIEAKGGVSESSNGTYIANGIGAGMDGTAENIIISPKDWRIEASVSSTGFDNMTELEGSPFVSGKTDVTEQVTGFQYFKTIGEYIPKVDMPSTGDHTSLILWASLLAMSSAMLLILKRRAA